MVTALLVAVIVLAALEIVHLLLLFGVIRRLREHEDRLANAGTVEAPPAVIAPAGHRTGEFVARTVAGRQLASATLDPPTLVGFLSPGCDACHERLPEFRKAVAAHPGSALAVVVQDGADTAPLLSELDGEVDVVLEDPRGALATAFDVKGFPAFALLGPDGSVLASGFELPLRA